MPTCPNCGVQQPQGTFFCEECGRPLRATPQAPSIVQSDSGGCTVMASGVCPVCGVPAMARDAFCANCGASLKPGAGELAVRPAIGKEAVAAAQPPPAPSRGPVCGKCGAAAAPDSLFYGTCGARLGSVSNMRGGPAVLSGSAALSLPEGKAEAVMGRDDPVRGIYPDIDLPPYGATEGGASRCHPRILVEADGFCIEDLHSANHTAINGENLVPGNCYRLHDEDEVTFGRVRVRLQTATAGVSV